MKKQWVKRENIYYKPFYKQKSKMLLLFVFLLGIVFLSYQVLTINQLSGTSSQIKRKREYSSLNVLLPTQNFAKDYDAGGGAVKAEVDVPADDGIKIIRGTRLFDYDSYKPNFDGKFKCLDGSAEIPFKYVNDDYCDCLSDGSDEPSTNACANGRFYCKYQKRHLTGRGRDIYVPSNRVNDGICDCCDGSDEWTTISCKVQCE